MLLGLLLIFWPGSGLVALGWAIAFAAIAVSVTMFWLASRFKGAKSAPEDESHTSALTQAQVLVFPAINLLTDVSWQTVGLQNALTAGRSVPVENLSFISSLL